MSDNCIADVWVRDDVRGWLKEARENGANYVFIGFDHSSYDDYPIEVKHDNIRSAIELHRRYQEMSSRTDAFILEDGKWKIIYPFKRYDEDQYGIQDGKWVRTASKGEFVVQCRKVILELGQPEGKYILLDKVRGDEDE